MLVTKDRAALNPGQRSFFCSGQQSMETCINGQSIENKRLSTQPQMRIYTNSPTTGAQGTSWKRRQKECENQRMERRAMKCWLGHAKAKAITTSRQLWLLAQKLHKIKLAKIPAQMV